MWGGIRGGPEVQGRQAVQATPNGMPPVDQLRIEERKLLLAIEKTLSNAHKTLDGCRRDAAICDEEEAVDALLAAQWSLGVAILQVARAQGAMR